MPWIKTDFSGVWIFEPNVFYDERGYFTETFNHTTLATTDIPSTFVQDNEAKSTKGVLRGLHYQVGEFAQSKLVRVVYGEVQDVIVDLRTEQPTYGQHLSILLSGQNKRQLYVPKGFAHGYLVTSEEAIFTYKCDNYYQKAAEGGLIYNDPALAINWLLDEVIVSDKDQVLPVLGSHRPIA